jgi:hypothetical protein
VVEGADSLLDGRVAIWPVSVDQVDVRETQPLEGSIEALDDVLPGQALVVDDVVAVGLAPVDLDGVTTSPLHCWQRVLTLVEMTRSFLFQPYLRMASPMTRTQRVSNDHPSAGSSQLTRLALATLVTLGSVKEVDTSIVGSLHTGVGSLCCAWG